MNVAGLTMEELLKIRTEVEDAILEKKKIDRQKAIAEVNSLLMQVNTLQEKYDINIEAYDVCEACYTSVSKFAICE